MYKKTPLNSLSDHGLSAEILDFYGGNALEKVASRTSYIPESLDRTIREIQAAPDKNSVYLYDRALGAGEVYGPNNNGDWFGKDELLAHHDSFVKSAALYRHHQNKGPSIGSVVASAYNEPLDTVDLIIRAPLDKLAADIRKLDSGHILGTSMGAKVKHDVCSYCGNQAKSRMQYCTHLRYHMLKIFEDGRQVYALNPEPRFIDISLVVIPAAPESAVLRKIAHQMSFDQLLFTKHAHVNRGVINPKVIESVVKYIKTADLISTLHAAKGPLRPDEFAAIMHKNANLIMEDATPFVGYSNGRGSFSGGKVLTKLAEELQTIPNIETGEKEVFASFMTSDEQRAYIEYRRITETIPGMFLR